MFSVGTEAWNSNTWHPHLVVQASGRVGVGTDAPREKLHVKGHMVLELDGTSNPTIYTGIGTQELNKYLSLINSPDKTSASGLKAGGILVSDAYGWGNPGKNDLLVKGSIGVGTNSPVAMLDVSGTLRAVSQIHLGGNYSEDNRGIVVDNGASTSWDLLKLKNISGTQLRVTGNGNVGIGTATPDEKLTVNGTVHAEEVKVDLTVPGPDYVFEKDYPLPSLEEVKKYIDEHKHLPEVPSAGEMEEEGVHLAAMNMILLKKVEELTLHLINMKEVSDTQSRELVELRKQVEILTNKTE